MPTFNCTLTLGPLPAVVMDASGLHLTRYMSVLGPPLELATARSSVRRKKE